MLGKHIREIRLDRNLTLGELSKHTGISKPYLSQIETGKVSRPSAEFVARIASSLGCQVETLLSAKGDYTFLGSTESSSCLRALAREEGLGNDDLSMLAHIHYEGRQPTTVAGWRAILDAIRQSTARLR